MLENMIASILAVPAWNWALQAAGLVTAYVGAELNARMKISGFVVWLASNVTLALLHAATGLWLLLVLDVLFFRVNLIGIRVWAKDRPHQVPKYLRMLLLGKHAQAPSAQTQ